MVLGLGYLVRLVDVMCGLDVCIVAVVECTRVIVERLIGVVDCHTKIGVLKLIVVNAVCGVVVRSVCVAQIDFSVSTEDYSWSWLMGAGGQAILAIAEVRLLMGSRLGMVEMIGECLRFRCRKGIVLVVVVVDDRYELVWM